MRFVILPDEQVAAQPRQVVDEKDAFQMIDLMLDDGCLQVREILLLLLALEVDIADAHQSGALDLGIHPGNGQATFVMNARRIAKGQDFRIDEHERLLGLIFALHCVKD